MFILQLYIGWQTKLVRVRTTSRRKFINFAKKKPAEAGSGVLGDKVYLPRKRSFLGC
jgi:hypothetical protein